MKEVSIEASGVSKKEVRSTSRWLLLLTFPLCAFFLCTGLATLWSLFRELYCRAYHETSYILCHYIDWEFRADIALIFFVSLPLYAIFHFWWMRRLSRRALIVSLVSLGMVWAVIAIAPRLIPGKFEAWY